MRWLEYIVFLALVVGLARPVGLYLARVFERKPTFLDPALRPIESLLYRLLGIHRQPRDVRWCIYPVFPALQRRKHGRVVPSAAGSTLAPWRARRSLPDHAHDRGPGGEHGDQFLDDYNLAGLWRRNHSSLPDPTAWSGLAKLPRGCGRPGRGDRLHPRLRPGTFGYRGQLLGGPRPSSALGPFAFGPGGQPRP